MGIFKKEKIHEQEKTQQAEFERKMADSKHRMSMFIDSFREGYRQLVLKHGIKFVPVMKFDQFRGIIISMAEQECREELELIHKQKEEVAKVEGDGVVKN